MLSLDLNKAAEERIQKLTSQIELVQSAFRSLEVNGPIEFTVNEYQAFLDQIAQIDRATGLNQKPVVYVYVLENHAENGETLFNRLREYKASPESKVFALSRSNKEFDKDSIALYVGSVKKDILSRIKQHLGLGPQKTYAMHLKHWVKESPKLQFYYIPLADSAQTYEVEAAIASQLKPLLGKSIEI